MISKSQMKRIACQKGCGIDECQLVNELSILQEEKRRLIDSIVQFGGFDEKTLKEYLKALGVSHV